MPRIFVNGQPVGLGCKTRPREKRPGAHVQVLADIVPSDQWEDMDLSWNCQKPLHQDNTRMCTAFTVVAGLHAARKDDGLPYIRLSPANLYARINNGRDGGALLEDALEAARASGVCTANTVPGDLDWQHGTPDGWEQEAAKFKVVDFCHCPNFEHVASAIQRGRFVCSSINVGSAFGTRDSEGGGVGPDGFVPEPTGGEVEGHSVLVVGMANLRGQWHLRIQNSWGVGWGEGGFGWVPISYWRRTEFRDAWCINAVVHPTPP